jgi:hypothetical protein
MERKYNYFYRIENLINGKFYYGVHKTDNLEDGYVGSGIRISKAIKKYGIENFKKENLLFFDTYDEALEYEIETINEELLLDPSCYNIAHGGGSWKDFNKTGENLKNLRKCPALIEKNSNKLIKPNNIKEYYQLFNTGNYYGYTKGKVFLRDSSENHYFLEKNDSKIKELNLKYTIKDKICCKDKNNKFYFVEKNDERILKGELKHCGIRKGKILSEKTKKKIGIANSVKQRGILNSQYGVKRYWITNEFIEKNKRIKRSEFEEFKMNGWKKGRKNYNMESELRRRAT